MSSNLLKRRTAGHGVFPDGGKDRRGAPTTPRRRRRFRVSSPGFLRHTTHHDPDHETYFERKGLLSDVDITCHFLTLSFSDGNVEDAFMTDFASRSRKPLRVTLLCGIIAYLLSGFVGYWSTLVVRDFIILPASFLVMIITFTPLFTTLFQFSVGILMLIVGLAHVVVAFQISSPEVTYDELRHRAVVVLMLLQIYFAIPCRLRFVNVLPLSILYLLGYESASWYWTGRSALQSSLQWSFALMIGTFMQLQACYLVELYHRKDFLVMQALVKERRLSDRLLLNILPKPIAERLRRKPSMAVDTYNSVTVLFADIVGFTRLSESISPCELVLLLNDIFARFDQLSEFYELEKIKTIGDCYMAVGGLPKPQDDHCFRVCAMALDVLDAVKDFNLVTHNNIQVRVGIDSGPVVAGVIGTHKFAFDIWGDTVNTASRMESHGIEGRIQCTRKVVDRAEDIFVFQCRGLVDVKGKGEMDTFFLNGLQGGVKTPRSMRQLSFEKRSLRLNHV